MLGTTLMPNRAAEKGRERKGENPPGAFAVQFPHGNDMERRRSVGQQRRGVPRGKYKKE